MKDFSIQQYQLLIEAFQKRDFLFRSFCQFVQAPSNDVIVLRHDVDAKKESSLKFARIQQTVGIVGSYYFRVVPQSWDESIIKEISEMGHEVGYHYETMDTCRGDVDKAYDEFCRNLEIFRKIVPINTICMHGSPLSKFNNRAIWKKYDYRTLGIIGEPYFEVDFNKVAYLTDTGRRWNGESVSVRDKVQSNYKIGPRTVRTRDGRTASRKRKKANVNGLRFRSTKDIIRAVEEGTFPKKAMITIHPQRWNDKFVPWMRELIWQNVKNVVKWGIVKWR